MRNVERRGHLYSSQLETDDKEGTYEQENGGDPSSKTIYNCKSSNSNVIAQKKVKKKEAEKIVFTD